MSGSGAARVTTATVWFAVLLLAAVVLVFAAIRVSVDSSNLATGTVPPVTEFDRRYALHPVLAYLHIGFGLVYLLGAPLQLSRRFRKRHIRVHRRTGRVVLPAGLAAGAYGVVFGVLYPWGGVGETTATVVFGAYFVAALLLAYRGVRRGDIAQHRRWMIRAFAVGLAVGSIRLWVGLFQALGLFSFRDSFGLAFWLAFATHALVAEAYLRRYPTVRGRTRRAPSRDSVGAPEDYVARRAGHRRLHG